MLEERCFEEWVSILELSTRWGFTSIRDLAIRRIKPPSPLQRLVVARKYDLEQWIVPALMELCQRPESLSFDEASLLDLEDFVLVASSRQSVRSSNLVVQGAAIRDHILAWDRNGELERPPGPVSDSPAPTTPPQPPSAVLFPSHVQQGSASSSGLTQISFHPGTVDPPTNPPAGLDPWASSKKKKGKKVSKLSTPVREESEV
jgi:hypothetical protein